MNPHNLPYGSALCPSCDGHVDLTSSPRGFTVPPTRGSKELFHYCLCEICGNRLSMLTDSSQIERAKEIVTSHVEGFQRDPKKQYAVTTLTALIANGGNIADAIEYGVDISRALSDAIMRGEVDPYEIEPMLCHLAHFRDVDSFEEGGCK